MGRIADIIKGHTKNILDIDRDLMLERLKICKACPLFKSDLGGICDSSKYINPETEEISDIELYGWIRGCGCALKAKTRLKDNHCVINKW